jgi:amino acid adenylation domain-containing protein
MGVLDSSESQEISIDIIKSFFSQKLECVHKIFEKTAHKFPERIAAKYYDDEISFEVLNNKSNQIAHYLISKGVNKNDGVLLFFNRGLDMIISLLGILKSGAAYIPVIPKFPKERIQQIIKDANIKYALSEKDLIETADFKNINVCTVEKICDNNDFSINNPNVEVDLNQLAYVIYTSGTTGKPKGAMIHHRALSSFYYTQQEIYFKNDDNLYNAALSAPLVFDFSVQQWVQVLAGHTLVMVPEECRYDGNLFIEYARKYNLNTIGFTPSETLMHIEAGLFNALPQITHLTLGGEAVSPGLWEIVANQTHIKAFNVYGPTECTVYVTTIQINHQNRLSIGKETSNSKLYVVDENLNEVPNGEKGELLIGGLCVGKGYLNNPELTKKKYVKTNFGRDEVFYRSGDLVRKAKDGNFDFLGRIDKQVKVRGYRIELEEIEFVLNSIPEIKLSACNVYEDEFGNKHLIGYVQCVSEINQEKIKVELSKKLPDYMVPNVFVFVDEFELTTNGKINTRALPKPDFKKFRNSDIADPVTQTQKLLVELWKKIIKTETVSINDNFFNIGGHSLMATQVVSHIRNELKKELKIEDVFSKPVLKDLAALIDALSETQNEVAFKKYPENGKFPLTYAQTRPWTIFQLKGPNSLYNILFEIKISGDLDINIFNASLKLLIDRHQILKTKFVETKNGVVQEFDDSIDVNVSVKDITHLDNKTDSISKDIIELGNYNFDLTKSPLFKIKIFKTDYQKYSVFICLHHNLTDGWSMGIFSKDLSQIYSDIYLHQKPQLPKLEFSYSDFVFNQQEYFKSRTYKNHLKYWKNELTDIPELLNLPVDKSRPIEQSFKGQTIGFCFENSVSQDVLNFGKANNLSPYMITMAAYFILLRKLSLSEDIVIGSVIANRNHRELENVFGFFSNTLMIRAVFEKDFTITEFLDYIREKNLKAFENQDIPMDKLLDEIKPNRNLAYNPLFQVVFNYQNMELGDLNFPGAKVDIEQLHNNTSKVDLTLNLRETGGCISGEIEFAKDLFFKESIENYIEYYKNIVSEIIENKELKISEIKISNKTKLPDYKNSFRFVPVTQLFEEAVNQFNENIALEFQEEKLNYGELNKLSNKYAQYFIKNISERIIGISLNRGLDAIAVIMGILKAGKAYLPIDKKYPIERKNAIIEDSSLKTLICSEIESLNIKQIEIEDLKKITCDLINTNPEIEIKENDPAYLIYTSGSTGKPKGVLVGHGSLSYFTQASAKHYHIDRVDKMLQFASISFDAAIEEIFPTLINGATLVVRDENMISSNKQFLKKCREYKISILDLPTAFWHQLTSELDILEKDDFEFIRTIILGGEAVKRSAVEKWFSHFDKQIELVNTYGPTEATVVATKHIICKSDLYAEIPIGKPIANASIIIIDENRNVLPLGVPGELCLGGNCLALGYFNKQKQTEEKFIHLNGLKFYRTGDLVRERIDGNLEFLGRIDKQVKIRGFRVELSEIENRIRQFEKTSECVVAAQNINQNHLDIVAYIVQKQGYEIKELKSYLEQNLPEFMVPTYFVEIDKIPLNISNKIDFKSLPKPNVTNRLVLENQYIEPQTKTQQTIHELWCELLKLEKISISENFFKIGGHSLLATQLISKIESNLGKEISLQKIFENPTIESLSKYIEEISISAKSKDSFAIIDKIDKNGLQPLSSSQKRMWFVDQLEGANASYNIPLDFKVKGKLNIEILEKSLHFIALKHDVLRTSFGVENGKPIQKISKEAKVDIKTFDLSEKLPEEIENEYGIITDANAQYIFNLEKSPLWRVQIVKISDDEHRLLLNFHHIISDGWSVGIFIRELSEVYQAFYRKEDIELQKPEIQYADYSAWQQKIIRSEKIKKQEIFWKEKLSGAPELIQLPLDFSRKNHQTFNGGEIRFTFDKSITKKIKELATDNNLSLYMVLFCGYIILLHKHSQQKDIVVGTPIANRKNKLTNETLGIFINNLAIRTAVIGNSSLKEFSILVKNTLLEAYKNQEAPFENVMEQLNLKRNLSVSPLFQVMFNLLNAHAEELIFPDATTEYLDIPRKIAKYDLSLIMSERRDELHAILEFNSDLFRESTIERFAEHYQQIIFSFLKSMSLKISEIDYLSKAEKKLFLKINNTKRDFPLDKCYHQLFEDSVEKYSDKVAINFSDTSKTYNEINQESNQLANYLIQKGVTNGDLIGVYLERSHKIVVALLAIMKAGAAYIPLDPIYPKNRIKLILDDAEPKAIISEKHLFDNLPENNSTIIDIFDKNIENQPSENPKIISGSSSLAYLIYTSGSTGKPKGVKIPHNALVNFLFSMIEKPGCNQKDTLLAVTTISFDIAGLELFMPLLTGAKVVISSQEESMNADLLMKLMKKYQPTIIQATPVTYKMLLMANWEGNIDLKILCGGEAFPVDLAQNLLEKSKEVWNMYGPTETTIWSTIKKVESTDSYAAYVSIGFPIANTQIYVVDEFMKPVPLGVPGELLIGGEGIASGYFKRPELSKERFIDSPNENGKKLYRTGDVVKINIDGNLQYLERMDNQVKIRGFRIELGEIENALKSIQKIEDAVVSVKENTKKDKYLVAYFTGTEKDLDRNFLAKEIRKKVPDYMVPCYYIQLDSFPLTPNGKIDRKQLPEPNEEKIKEHNKPLNGGEEILYGIWKELLENNNFGIDDDFFAIGGHSLLAVNLMIKIEEKIGVRLPLATLFNNSTIRNLAEYIASENNKISWKSLVPIKPEGSKKPVYIVHGAGLNVLLFDTLVQNLDKEQPVFGLQAKGLDGKEKPLETIEEIAAHYITEILENDPNGPYALAGYSLGGIIAFEMARQLKKNNKEVAFLGMFDTVAYSSLKELSSTKRIIYLIKFRTSQIVFNIIQFLKEPMPQKKQYLIWKRKSLERRIKSFIYRQKVNKVQAKTSKGDKEDLPEYLYNVHEANNRAGDNYTLQPSDLQVELFKAEHQTFYIEEPETYNWKKYARKGVMLHEIPGEHSSIFAPPNDKGFAEILQNCLDKNFKKKCIK